MNQYYPNHLAWHETLELHELVAYQAAHLVDFKKGLPSIENPDLRNLYVAAITSVEQNLRELLQYYPQAPVGDRKSPPELLAAESALLLGFLKSSVKYYAHAITETATPQLRNTLQKHLNTAIAMHAKVYQFMYSRGMYPSYNLEQLLANDIKIAQAAINL
jgi:spore coat protein F